MHTTRTVGITGAAILGLCAFAPAFSMEPASPEDSVRAADIAFSDALQARDREAFAAMIARDAVFFGGQQPHRGREAILEAWSVYFSEDGPRLSWNPAKVEVNESRQLATSTGPYELRAPANGEQPARLMEGTYFSVWALGDDGQWRVIFDTGTAPTESRTPAIQD